MENQLWIFPSLGVRVGLRPRALAQSGARPTRISSALLVLLGPGSV